jgi:hypothetical protein
MTRPRHYISNPESSPWPEWSAKLAADAAEKMRHLAAYVLAMPTKEQRKEVLAKIRRRHGNGADDKLEAEILRQHRAMKK